MHYYIVYVVVNLLVYHCNGNEIYSDKRIKSNVELADTKKLLETIQQLKLHEFDYNYEQFYNPLFGKRTTGFIAQEVREFLPAAVGVVKKRKIPLGDGKFEEIEDLHVLNQGALYMANIGVSQELIKRTDSIVNQLSAVGEKVHVVETDNSAIGTKVQSAIKELKDQQDKIELVANAAHSKGELAMNDLLTTKTENIKSFLEAKSRDEQLESKINQLETSRDADLVKVKEDLLVRLQEKELEFKTELESNKIIADQADQRINSTLHQVEEMTQLTNQVKSIVDDLNKKYATDVELLTAQQKEQTTKLQDVVKVNTIQDKAIEELKSVQVKLQSDGDDTKLLLAKAEETTSNTIETAKSDLRTAIDTVKQSLDAFKENTLTESSTTKAKVEEFHKVLEKLEASMDGVKTIVDDKIQQATEDAVKKSHESARELVKQSFDASNKTVDGHLGELRTVDQTHNTEIDLLKQQIVILEEKVSEQAAAELVEKRKIMEAEVRIAEARIEEQKVKGEEERKTAELHVQHEIEKEKRFNETSVKRLANEESIKKKRELEVLEAQEASALRQRQFEAEKSIEVSQEQGKIELQKLEAERETRLAELRIAKEAEIEQERKNKDVHAEMMMLQADEDRKKVIAAIQTGFQESIEAISWLGENPMYVVNAGLFLVFVFGSISMAKELSVIIRRRIEQAIGRPSLVRESSQSQFFSLPIVSWFYFGPKQQFKAVKEGTIRRRASSTGSNNKKSNNNDPSDSDDSKGTPSNSSNKVWQTAISMEDAFSDVVLSRDTYEQIRRISISTATAHSRNSPLRHVMFYGPPGTGKTMVAKRMAKWCGLDYAIMSGADVAPLQEQAVTEIHSLFKWAQKTPRGVLLFIDEADAFLCSRNNTNLSESARNALTALLYHTGNPSCKVMLVLATNRPRDMDSAIIDRIDESVQFCKPGINERAKLVEFYFEREIVHHSLSYHTKQEKLHPPGRFDWICRRKAMDKNSLIQVDQVGSNELRTVAQMLDGFSGREISKLFITLQAQAFGSVADQMDSNGPYLDRHIVQSVAKAAVARHKAVENYDKHV